MRQIRNISRKGLAAFFAVWLSGIVFVFCCDVSAQAASKDSCPLAKAATSHCDKGKANKNSQLASTEGACELNGCGLVTGVFDKTRKVERDVQAAQPADLPAVAPRTFALVGLTFSAPAFYTSFRPVQDKIFIKHHVFRI